MSAISIKSTADALRAELASLDINLKASHAHELIAAAFGYHTKTSLLADPSFEELDQCEVWIVSSETLKQRLTTLNGLPADLPEVSYLLAVIIQLAKPETVKHLWSEDNLLESIELSVDRFDNELTNLLSGPMAETNAEFSDFPTITWADLDLHLAGGTTLSISGEYQGEQMEDKPYCGHEIRFDAQVVLRPRAGKVGFDIADIELESADRADWGEPDWNYMEGLMAYNEGLGPNPHPPGSPASDQWEKGFTVAEEDNSLN